ncbi:polyketide cyclase/dehydrase and lipid transportsuperfamily protein [Striga asiatica]|uniref:Polyketide cyclase/dehydrase and lipid transportsuperfamily protein n=1 Tax=Striga asiatica TaxID=4170 RepID=A0A5A7R8G6_STRAF|nr:polyketide cyclase/dehydrase and lipid transportsuperfamily protein [Striga asiatica]
MVVQTEYEFWMGNGKLAGDWWPWTWSLAAVLLIFTFRLLTFRFRFSRRRPAVSIPVKTKTGGGLPPIRGTGIISDLDLKNLINELDEKSPENGVVWENVVDKNNNLISYKAKCCKPKDGPLKYLSVTIFEDCSVEKLVGFYMDNSYRVQWDKTVVHYQQLQMDGDSGTEFGRMIKKFPLLTPRDYILAWRVWQGLDGSFYCFSKFSNVYDRTAYVHFDWECCLVAMVWSSLSECGHPLAPHEKRYVRVALFRSVPGRNACEIKMVHQEDAGLNVEMAKVAFSKGIWNYVRKMDDALRKYSAGRQHLLNSNPDASLFVQKVPPEFEVMNDNTNTGHPENSAAANNQLDTCWSKKSRKLKKWPSSKLIANGFIVLGGAICLSRGHSSLATKVAMAYLLTKLTKQCASSKKDL